MRRLGFITNIETTPITIAIWDFTTSTIITHQPANFIPTKEYELLSIIEYNQEKDTATTTTNINFTQEENKQLLDIFKQIIEIPYLNQAFLTQLDRLYKKTR